jgi:hypothetical protein
MRDQNFELQSKSRAAETQAKRMTSEVADKDKQLRIMTGYFILNLCCIIGLHILLISNAGLSYDKIIIRLYHLFLVFKAYLVLFSYLDQNSELLRLLESEESLTASLQAEVAEYRTELGTHIFT